MVLCRIANAGTCTYVRALNMRSICKLLASVVGCECCAIACGSARRVLISSVRCATAPTARRACSALVMYEIRVDYVVKAAPCVAAMSGLHVPIALFSGRFRCRTQYVARTVHDKEHLFKSGLAPSVGIRLRQFLQASPAPSCSCVAGAP